MIFSKKKTENQLIGVAQIQIAESRASAKQLAAQLRAIIFDDPENKLSAEIIEEKDYKGIIDFLAAALDDSKIMPYDVSKIDAAIKKAATALKWALRNGAKNTAEGAVNALTRIILVIRQDISDEEGENAEALLTEMEKYIENYDVLIENFKTVDAKDDAIAKQELHLSREKERYNQQLAEFSVFNETKEGKLARENMEAHINKPQYLTEAGKKYRDYLTDLKNLDGRIASVQTTIDADRMSRNTALNTIQDLKVNLMRLPRVVDQNMLNKLRTINKRTEREILENLERVKEINDVQDEHNAAMEQIANSAIFQQEIAGALQYQQKMEADELRRELERKAALDKEKERKSSILNNVRQQNDEKERQLQEQTENEESSEEEYTEYESE